MRYRRSQTQGAIFFFTVVTCDRKKLLCADDNALRLKQAIEAVKVDHPFVVDAIVVLPDHLHCIWTLPEGDSDFSTRWMLVKSKFTRTCARSNEGRPGASRISKREQGVWQRRFWKHQIRDEQDYIQHVDYIYYNPVKYRLAEAPIAWKYSSFNRFVKGGIYHADWGAKARIVFDGWIGNE
jgi:REP-associated tyrosine transposase